MCICGADKMKLNDFEKSKILNSTVSYNQIEKWSNKHQLNQIELNVYNFNNKAKTLYKKLGFEDLTIKMQKRLT